MIIGISLNAPIFVSKTNIRRNRVFSYTCLLHLTNNYIPMKYLEFTFHTTPCTEIVNDVLSAVLGEVGFESFVEQTDGITAYIQKDLYNETVLKEALADFPLPDTQVEYAYQEAEDKDWNEEWEKNFFRPLCHPQHIPSRHSASRIRYSHQPSNGIRYRTPRNNQSHYR